MYGLIKKYEGCKLTAYKCPAGVWTIGWGSTIYPSGQPVKSGDKITFTNNESGETLVCLVEDIKVFNSFESLYLAYDKTKLGYKPYETANPEDMKIYYPLASMQEQGVCAIEIKLI